MIKPTINNDGYWARGGRGFFGIFFW